jgi:3-deoxy-D-manno-octulosonic-acid transferase
MLALITYNLVLLLLSPLALVWALWRVTITGKSRHGIGERLGFIPASKITGDSPRIWLHAVSVGETVAARPIWQALLQALPGWQLYHSTTTATGQGQAEKVVGEEGTVLFFPFDFLPCVWLAFSRVHPRLVVLVETELWPNFLAVARLRGARVVLANGIISDRSMRSAARLRPLYRWMTGNLDGCCMQSEEDARRIIALGADPARVTVTGNTKFDQVLTEVSLGEQMTLRQALGLQREERVLLAGSTHPGEEEIVLRAFRQVKTADPSVRLVIAPRQVQRAQEIEELAIAHGFAVIRRTKLSALPPPPDAVIILDTIGELARAYALSTAAVVGGSFVPVGGHNVLEPLGLGRPAIFGPHMHKNRDIATIVQQAGVGFQVADADELAARWRECLASPARCRQIADAAAIMFQHQRGAAQRCAEAICRWLHDTPVPQG